ncbi:hypothetical protein [Paenibacillus sp. GYB003]|uniref:hypothetical protein n=1 Tax=Paenibacillus sp. GYB003 TaxID=2994392 RepID=UPI002F96109A
MNMHYEWDAETIRIEESANGEDTEFAIEIVRHDPFAESMKRVQAHFEANEVHTDVLFYAYPGHRYQVIVRKDYYVDFLLELMKHRLLRALEWK